MTMFTFIKITLLIIIIKLTLLLYRNRKNHFKIFKNLKISTPKLLNIFEGNFRLFDRQFIFLSMPKWFDEYGKTFGYFLGIQPILCTKDFDIIRKIFITNNNYYMNRLKHAIDLYPFNSTILALRDERWRKNRRILTPAFNPIRIKSSKLLKSLINKSLNNLNNILIKNKNIDYVITENNKKLKININELSKRFTLDIIFNYVFNINSENFYDDKNCKLYQKIEKFFNENCDTIIVRMAMIFPFIGEIIKFCYNYKLLPNTIITDLCKYLEQQINNNIDENDNDTDDTLLLNFIIKNFRKNQINKNEIIGNLLIILMAGYETTSNSLIFILFNLARYPHIQMKLRKVLMEYNNDNNLNECNYLNRIILETLRLYPPVVDYLIRELNDNFNEFELELSIENGDKRMIKLPKNIAIQIPIWIIHHDSNIWSDPYKFDPDRNELSSLLFNSNLSSTLSSIKINDPKYLTFGLGQRHCIGASFAMNEIRSFINYFIKNYQINLLNNFQYKYDEQNLLLVKKHAELIKPYDDIWIEFEKL